MKAVKREATPSAAAARFKKLARAWKAETELVSKIAKRVIHPAYQKIIGMGEPAIPLILQDLVENGPDDWFWASDRHHSGPEPDHQNDRLAT